MQEEISREFAHHEMQQIPAVDSQKQKTYVLSRTSSSCVMSCCPRSIETTARRGWQTCALLYLFDLGTWLTKQHRVPHSQNFKKLAMLVLCCRLLLCIFLLIRASHSSLVPEVVLCCFPWSRTLGLASYNLLVFDCFARFKTHDLPNWCRLQAIYVERVAHGIMEDNVLGSTHWDSLVCYVEKGNHNSRCFAA